MLVEQAVLDRVIHHSLRGGGGFAEIFVEDRRGTLARLDDGRVEDVASGRDRGAGIRVVAGDTTGFAHTSDLSEAGLRAAAEAAAGGPPGGGGGGGRGGGGRRQGRRRRRAHGGPAPGRGPGPKRR
jgi:TldD protein